MRQPSIFNPDMVAANFEKRFTISEVENGYVIDLLELADIPPGICAPHDEEYDPIMAPIKEGNRPPRKFPIEKTFVAGSLGDVVKQMKAYFEEKRNG